ncbi:MAG: hypothetical protein ACP5E5_07925 [Acidobacteriaceae bacterium]
MAYERPKSPSLPPEEKRILLKQYVEHYWALYKRNPNALNAKLPKSAFDDLLNKLGEMLLAESRSLASNGGRVGTFLDDNPLPAAIDKHLPREYRAFCLALHAIKQWVAAEQNATDRYLFGGASRKLCREAAESYLVTGERLGPDCELHHPVRDGRPAIPLSKEGHDQREHQKSSEGNDPIGKELYRLKGNHSWVQLRRGCLDFLGRPKPGLSKRSAANARAFAKKPAAATQESCEAILGWLNENKL